MTHAIEIVAYTDPYCTWCWGSEPMLRHLQESYSEQITIRSVMGGLVEDFGSFRDPMNSIGGGDASIQPIADHWIEASVRHGMPVNTAEFLKAPFRSTWPSNIAYEAANLQDESVATRYLRRLRESAATESNDLGDPEVLADLAREVGLDRARFLVDFNGRARDAFARDRLECIQRGVHGFPTFLVTANGKDRLARGYRSYEQMVGLIDLLAGEPVERREPDFDDLGVLDFVEKYGSAAVREVAEVFGVSDTEAKAALGRLVAAGALALPEPGLLYRTPASVACDPATGRCV
ncbi:MAG: DsbA family protein [Actinobacteria bacterium]|nr:MAG: DsbA family protein [Actinomycetota bacterium]